MPINTDDLVNNGTYFVAKSSVVLRETETGSGKINHLLLGDWLKYLGEFHDTGSKTYVKVKCRGDLGWLKLNEITDERALEVNFVDIGQGDGCHIVTPDDDVLLIDAGESDNMHRFLCWRYNLRGRNVAGAPDFDPEREADDPWLIDYVVMSHPDLDHYGGFTPIFENPKLAFDKVYHNGIVERPAEDEVNGVTYPDDLGGEILIDNREYLYDYVSDSNKLKDIVTGHPRTRKKLLSAYRDLFANSPNATVETVGVHKDNLADDVFLPDFEDDKKFSLKILGPVREDVDFQGETLTAVRTLGAEGKTKNGHSIIFKGKYGDLTLLLGGDLNSQSQDFLLQCYSQSDETPSELEAAIKKLRHKRQPLGQDDQEELDTLIQKLETMEQTGRDIFEVDVAKACHHGSQHVIDSFIRSVNASATVISSGDNESHSHPRPDALGAYGKYGRGRRPLIFSTELARSTKEFTTQTKNYLALRGITLQIEAETNERKKKALIASLDDMKDRNVAVYGMITLRALGDTVILAQKLEEARSESQKWDIYKLTPDPVTGHFVYDDH